MSSNQTVVKSSNLFSITSTRPQCHYKHMSADFTAPPSLNRSSKSIVPVYLEDKNFFTPAFVIPRDSEYFTTNIAFEREKFLLKVIKANNLCQDSIQTNLNQQEIGLPVPTTNFCQICKSSFSSYIEHIRDVNHLRQARFSKANKYINQLSKKFNKKEKKKGSKDANKKICKKQGQGCKLKKPILRCKKAQVIQQNGVGLKHNNCSTNLNSIVPTPY